MPGKRKYLLFQRSCLYSIHRTESFWFVDAAVYRMFMTFLDVRKDGI